MDTFEASSNHRNNWSNYSTECYPDYYRSYGTARKKITRIISWLKLSFFFLQALTSLPWVESSKYSVANWSSQTASTFPYPSSHPQPAHTHANFLSTTNPSSFGQTYYPPTPPKDLPHDTLLDSSNKQQHQNVSPTANYHSQHNWGHVLKDPSIFWSNMKSSPDSPNKNFNSKKKPSQGLNRNKKFVLLVRLISIFSRRSGMC